MSPTHHLPSVRIVCATAAELPRPLLRALGRYRHHVFIQRLGWPLCEKDGIERDQFDQPATLHVIALDEAGEVSGCARLLPTTGPTLQGVIFPDLLPDAPQDAATWELTRFAANCPAAVTALLDAVFAEASARGARRLLTLSPRGVERLLRRRGLHFARLGRQVRMQGRLVSPYIIGIPEPQE